MANLRKSLLAWGSPAFESVLKDELSEHAEALPLQKALAHSSTVADTPISVLFQHVADTGGAIRVKAGIFFEGLQGGCACANDPTPESPVTEYCEVEVDIDKSSGEAKITLLPD